MLGAARLQNDASIVPYKLVAMFIADFKVSPRRDEGIPPYRVMAYIDKYKITPPAAFHAVMRDCLSRELFYIYQYMPSPCRAGCPHPAAEKL